MSLPDPSSRQSTTHREQGHDHVQNDYTFPKPGRLNLRETYTERNARIKRTAEKDMRDRDATIRRANRDHAHVHVQQHMDEAELEYLRYTVRQEQELAGRSFWQTLDMQIPGFEPSLAGFGNGNLHRTDTWSRTDIRIPARYTSTSTYYQNYTTTSTSARAGNTRQTEQEYRDDLYRQMEYARSRTAKQKAREAAQEKQAAEEDELRRQEYEAAKEEHRQHKREKEKRKRDREKAFEEMEGNGQGEKRGRRGSTSPEEGWYGFGRGLDHEIHYQNYKNQGLKKRKQEQEEKERERYLSRWKSLLNTQFNDDGDGIIETELSYTDIPWPTYSQTPLDKSSIKSFLSSFTTSSDSKNEQERKILREGIRNFHPDRFISKILPRVRSDERARVKEGMEICSRVLTDLISDNSNSR